MREVMISTQKIGFYVQVLLVEIVLRLPEISLRRQFAGREGAMDLEIPCTKVCRACGRGNGGLQGSFSRRHIAFPCTMPMPEFQLLATHRSAS